VYYVGQKEKSEKRDLARECLLVKPLSFWSHNTRKKHKKRGDEEKQIFSEKAKFSRFGGQIYIKSISRETSLLLNLLCIVCAFSALLERESQRDRERNDVSFSLSFFSLCETPIPRVRRRRCKRWGTTTVPKTPTSSSSRRKTPTRTESDL
jgi:hypothetical protein